MRKRYALFAALMLVSALALSACGGSGDGGGSDEEAEIESAIETSATTADPTNCTKLETLTFVEQSSEGSGKAAITECEEEAKDVTGKADSVEVTNIEVDGSKATADAAVSGGSLDGQTVTIALVEDEGWKLDQLTGFAKLDVGNIVAAFREGLEESSELSAEQTECIVGEIEVADEADIEELVLGGSSATIEEAAEACE